MSDLFGNTTQEQDLMLEKQRPLAERLRPKLLDDVVGQAHLIGENAPLRRMVESGILSSMILWGPPGCGKTTFARLLADQTDMKFEQISAIFSGVKDLRAVFDSARLRFKNGQKTLLFVDEIHRFNKSQQDAFLPVMEDGTITLVGATTENPSFELNSALLSRSQVFVLEKLEEESLGQLIDRAEAEYDRSLPLDERARVHLLSLADGDGRYLLSVIEQIYAQTSDGEVLDMQQLGLVVQKRAPLYDKTDDAYYNLLSAFHKSLRGSDSDGALYWMARMIEGGEDPTTLFRRMTAMASEDISNADPQALPLVVAAWQAYERLGAPEGYIPLAQAVTYLATAPKSNASYKALAAARDLARKSGSAMPPKHAMNAPTKLMKDIGYTDGYQYDHDSADGYAGQSFMPDEIGRVDFYQPVERGFEREIKKRMEFFAKKRSS